MAKQNKSNILPIAVMFLLFFMIAFVTNLAGSMGVIVKNQFGVSNALSQLGTLANFIAYACMGIPAGIILKRKGYKFTALAAVIVGLIGVAIQWISGPAESFAVYVAGAFVAGFSMCMLNVVVNPMLNTLGGGGKKGNQLCQFGGSCNSIGGTLAPILVGYLVGGAIKYAKVSDAAPVMIIAMAVFALAAVVIFFTNIPEPHMETAEEKQARLSGNKVKDPHGPMSFRHFVLGAIAIFFYVGVEVGIPNIANLYMTTYNHDQAQLTIDEYQKQQNDADYLAECKAADDAAKEMKVEDYEEKVVSLDNYNAAVNVREGKAVAGLGLQASIAGLLIGFYWLMMLFGRLIGGTIGGKVSSKQMLTVVSSLAIIMLLCVMFIPSSIGIMIKGTMVPVSMVIMFLCGLCTSVMWGSIFNMSTEGLGKYTPAASGIFMVLVCGGGVVPFIQGLVADHIGFTLSYIVLIAALAYILYYALIGSKNVNKDIKVD